MGYLNFSSDENIITQHLIVVAHNLPNDNLDLLTISEIPDTSPLCAASMICLRFD